MPWVRAEEEEGEEEGLESGGDEELIDNDALADAYTLHKGQEDVLAKVGVSGGSRCLFGCLDSLHSQLLTFCMPSSCT